MPTAGKFLPFAQSTKHPLHQRIIRKRIGLIPFLPSEMVHNFVLNIIDEQKSEEVCKTLQVSSTNLYVLLHRARLRLRDCLEKKGIGQAGAVKG